MWARSTVVGRPTVGRAASVDRRGRVVLFALAALALLAGLWGALGRLGVSLAAPAPAMAWHGALMTMGFLGSVISLERAVAVGRPWAYLAPAAAGAGTLLLLAGAPFALWAFVAAASVFTIVCAYMWSVRADIPTGAMAVGGAAWVVAALALAMRAPVAGVVQLLAAFLVLTVAGERVGLSKIAHPPRWSPVPFAIGCALLIVGALVALGSADGIRLAGLGLLTLAVWLGLWDLAWRNVRRTGVTRYMAVALVAGYVWLAVAGLAWVLTPDTSTVFAFDAQIHTVFVGFVLSMIFAHELMIVPALLGIALPFTRAFYVPLVLLHASLAARVAGDVLADAQIWQWASLANVVAVALFAAVSVAAARGLLGPAKPT